MNALIYVSGFLDLGNTAEILVFEWKPRVHNALIWSHKCYEITVPSQHRNSYFLVLVFFSPCTPCTSSSFLCPGQAGSHRLGRSQGTPDSMHFPRRNLDGSDNDRKRAEDMGLQISLGPQGGGRQTCNPPPPSLYTIPWCPVTTFSSPTLIPHECFRDSY